jgi:4-amino-4-deoxy-L-arabinose transferase-like glycosyltransferase
MFGRKPNKKNRPVAAPSARSASPVASRIRALEKFVVEEIELCPVTDQTGASPRARTPRVWGESVRFIGAWSGLWLMLLLASLFGRSPWPTDETRLLAAAWEMWSRRDLLLPMVNGELHAHPPLVAWLIHAGWAAFGVVEWWARLVPALGALASLFLTWRIARLLWPQHVEVANVAPLVLLGTLAWSAFTGFVAPHAWLVACALFGVWALAFMWRRRDHRAWPLLAAATAFGLLATGWVYLLYVYPVALLAPLWAREGRRPEWRYWYVDIFKSILLGVVPLAVWLVAIGLRDGWTSVYELTLRAPLLPALDLLAVRTQHWWYAAWLPLVFLPWSVWPVVWLRHWQLRRAPLNAGLLFCLVWVLAAVGLLSTLPDKQPHWLLPLLPAGALVVAFLVLDEELRGADENRLLAAMTLPVVLLGAFVMVAPKLPRVDWAPELLWQISPFVGLGIMVVGVALAWLPVRETRRRLLDMAAVSAVSVVLAMLALGSQLDEHLRVEEIAAALNAMERDHRPIAVVGEYRGEFHFAGRLQRRVSVLPPQRVLSWAQNYPDGVVVAHGGNWRPAAGARALHEVTHGDDTVTMWDAESLLPRGAQGAPDP